MPARPSKHLAFTLNSLQTYLDILERNDLSESERKVSLGWIFKFTDGDDVPTEITQLVMHITLDEDGLNIGFKNQPVGYLLESPDPTVYSSPVSFQRYKHETVDTDPYLAQVISTAREDLRPEHFAPSTKAVFFSRTQLLLFRAMLRVADDNHLETDVLFSGFKLDTGYMTAVRNMAEQSYLSASYSINAKEWFTLKAELWSKNEDGIDGAEIRQAVAVDTAAREAAARAAEVGVTERTVTITRVGRTAKVAVSDVEPVGCEDANAARHPLLAFGQPCPPGWGTKGQGGAAALPYLNNLVGYPIESIIAQALCAMDAVFEDVAAGNSSKEHTVSIAPKKKK